MDLHVPPKPYAPIIWLLTALAVGYGWAEVAPTGGRVADKLALAAVALAGAWVLRKAWRWRMYLWLACVVAANLYYGAAAARMEPPAGASAPHETTVTLEIRQRFALKETSGVAAGMGVVVDAPDEPELKGARVAYFAKWLPQTPSERGQAVRFSGILRTVKTPPKWNPWIDTGATAPSVEKASAAKRSAKSDGFEDYLWGQHIPYRLERARATEITAPAPWPMRIVEASRRWVIATLERGNPYGDGLLPAMVMGAKAEMTRDQTHDFVRSGTYHLVAVSGMNVMVVAALLWGLGRAVGLPRVALGLVVVGVLYFYAQVTGATASVMRAWGMVALAVGASLMRRQANLWPVIVLAAVGSLILEPLSLWHGGWRLSFGVVAGLVLGMAAVERRWEAVWPKGLGGEALKAIAVSFVACLAVAPMTAAYWGLAQPWGFVLNTLAVFLAGWVTLLGSASVLVGWLPWVPEAINIVGGWIIWAIEWLIKAYLALPASAIEVPWWPSWAGGVGTLLILWGLWWAAKRTKTVRNAFLN